jgi:hypothetical protein
MVLQPSAVLAIFSTRIKSSAVAWCRNYTQRPLGLAPMTASLHRDESAEDGGA